MSGPTLENVTNAHRNWYMEVLVSQKICDQFSLRFIVIGFKVIENKHADMS